MAGSHKRDSLARILPGVAPGKRLDSFPANDIQHQIRRAFHPPSAHSRFAQRDGAKPGSHSCTNASRPRVPFQNFLDLHLIGELRIDFRLRQCRAEEYARRPRVTIELGGNYVLGGRESLRMCERRAAAVSQQKTPILRITTRLADAVWICQREYRAGTACPGRRIIRYAELTSERRALRGDALQQSRIDLRTVQRGRFRSRM